MARQMGTDVFDVSGETAGLFGQWIGRSEASILPPQGQIIARIQGALSNPAVRWLAEKGAHAALGYTIHKLTERFGFVKTSLPSFESPWPI